MQSFGDNVRKFNAALTLEGIKLPAPIEAMNPFRGENAGLIDRVTGQFYGQYYPDVNPRHIIFGINPGRHGADRR